MCQDEDFDFAPTANANMVRMKYHYTIHSKRADNQHTLLESKIVESG